jgi:NitT/TauT family transport system substrate-binding protein
MGCCEATNPDLIGIASRGDASLTFDRRTALKGMLGFAGAMFVSACGPKPTGESTTLRLAFCGQLLCVVPYEVARARGHFADQGFQIELVYTRGGNAAMQALVGGAVEYAGTSFDVALQAVANGAAIRRFVSTGRLPLFALAVGPKRADEIRTVKSLEGTTIGVSGLGNADHALLLYLLEQEGADGSTIRFATIGTNLFDAVRIGQVDAAMVQEPALSLIIDAGGRELVNLMEIEHSRTHLGGSYEFMGVAVRAAERDQRLPEMRRVAQALANGLADTRTIPPDEIVAALPEALLAGSDVAQLKRIIERYRLSLYPETVQIDVDAVQRVVRAQEIAGLLAPGAVPLNTLLDVDAVGG